ncbi:hypothetical protein [Cupriavidus basilensis]|uniref:hypothetical protein n=1 Tax=Cupriavidus basilensis TaxID=68895 RepID=UPI0023E82340|nr:hypothetical protein [Cupriavidus basilensis]MDF3882982.1 hypothetical protein [Cupriavidus basilensis]
MGSWLAGMIDHHRMIIDFNETRVRTIEQVRVMIDGTETLEFFPPRTHTRAAHGSPRCRAGCIIAR